jgi:hypothetical protein
MLGNTGLHGYGGAGEDYYMSCSQGLRISSSRNQVGSPTRDVS